MANNSMLSIVCLQKHFLQIAKITLFTSAAWGASFLLTACHAAPSSSHPTAATSTPETGEHFEQWLTRFKQTAIEQGIQEKTLRELDSVVPNPRVIALDRKQPESVKRYSQYKKSILTPSRIQKARTLYHTHKTALDRISKQYGVPAPFIVSLWGIETNFGTYTGSFDVIRSLATLAYEGRRRELFSNELIASLRMIQDHHLTRTNLKGSWAAAMGQTQFMPSSFLKYAVDTNKDGVADIWNTKSDVFASIAHYLSTVGWDPHLKWGRRVTTPASLPDDVKGIKVTKTLAEWQQLGVRLPGGKPLPESSLQASLILPDKQSTESYLVYANYKTLLDWNRSLYFATTVGLLADAIE